LALPTREKGGRVVVARGPKKSFVVALFPNYTRKGKERKGGGTIYTSLRSDEDGEGAQAGVAAGGESKEGPVITIFPSLRRGKRKREGRRKRVAFTPYFIRDMGGRDASLRVVETIYR